MWDDFASAIDGWKWGMRGRGGKLKLLQSTASAVIAPTAEINISKINIENRCDFPGIFQYP
jgi:hypothetical protein